MRILPLLGALILSAQPAHSVGWARRLSDQMRSFGVRVEVVSTCSNNTNAVGTYNRRSNILCIATSHIDHDGLLIETVTHEAVHVIQDCLGGGLHSAGQRSIADYLIKNRGFSAKAVVEQFKTLHHSSLNHTRKVLTDADDRTREMEFEAYALESHPARVFDLLKLTCAT